MGPETPDHSTSSSHNEGGNSEQFHTQSAFLLPPSSSVPPSVATSFYVLHRGQKSAINKSRLEHVFLFCLCEKKVHECMIVCGTVHE